MKWRNLRMLRGCAVFFMYVFAALFFMHVLAALFMYGLAVLFFHVRADCVRRTLVCPGLRRRTAHCLNLEQTARRLKFRTEQNRLHTVRI